MVAASLPVFGGLTAQISWLGLRVGGHPALSVHSSDEPVNSHNDFGHCDSTMKSDALTTRLLRPALYARYSEAPVE